MLLVFAAAAPLHARADSPSVGITLNAATGVHAEAGGTANAPLLAVPITDIRAPLGRFEVRGEWLPPIGPIRFTGSALNIQTTTIGYASAMVYFRLPDSQLRVALGETLFNQQTRYSTANAFGGSMQRIDQTLSSRVGGLRVALMLRRPIGPRFSLTGEVAASPSMHAEVYGTQTVAIYSRGSLVSSWSRRAKTPETASLVDAKLYFEQKSGRTALTYGLRYVNYAAVFDRTQAIADRNRLLIGFLGLRQFFR